MGARRYIACIACKVCNDVGKFWNVENDLLIYNNSHHNIKIPYELIKFMQFIILNDLIIIIIIRLCIKLLLQLVPNLDELFCHSNFSYYLTCYSSYYQFLDQKSFLNSNRILRNEISVSYANKKFQIQFFKKDLRQKTSNSNTIFKELMTQRFAK